MLRARKDSHRDFLRSQSIVRKRKKKNLIRLLFRIVLLLALLVSIIFVLRLDSLQIKKVIVVGSNSETMNYVKSIADEQLSGDYFSIVPNRNALFYPKDSIQNKILQDEPHIKELSMSTEGFGILNIKLIERVPVMKWCNLDSCFNIDENSFVYSVYEGEDLLQVSGGELASSTKQIQHYAFDTKVFEIMKETVQALASSSLSVVHIAYRTPEQIEYVINGNGYVIVSGKRPLEESLGNLSAALKSSRFTPGTSFEYIDTRFGNKVFFKIKENKGSSTSATSTVKY